MKNLLIAFLFLLSSNAFAQTSIDKFEENLSTQDLVVLDKLVACYDSLIENKFDGDDYQFLTNIRYFTSIDSVINIGDSTWYRQLTQEFKASTLYERYDRMDYDTVYAIYQNDDGSALEKDEHRIVYVFQDGDTVKESIIIDIPEEAIIEIENQRGYNEFIHQSSFVEALKQSNNSDTLVLNYIEFIDAIGNASPSVMAEGIVYRNINTDEYFMKRIIAFEIFRKTIDRRFFSNGVSSHKTNK